MFGHASLERGLMSGFDKSRMGAPRELEPDSGRGHNICTSFLSVNVQPSCVSQAPRVFQTPISRTFSDRSFSDWCDLDTGYTTITDAEGRPRSVYISVTRDGSVWLRAGVEHMASDWIYRFVHVCTVKVIVTSLNLTDNEHIVVY